MVSFKEGDTKQVRRHLSLKRLRDALKEELSSEKLKLITGWELLGNIVILKLPRGLEDSKFLIGEMVLKLHPKAQSVVNRKEIKGVYREPEVELIAGTKTKTLHKENGCIFKVDPTKVMFSFGNLEERKRMANISNEKETVIDMFACVGQFSIPMAKHSNPKATYAVEKNPAAFNFLKENIRLNNLKNMHPILGDCRKVTPKNLADRVVMGYLFETHKYLPSAVDALKNGGMIHYHTTSHKEDIEREEKTVKDIVKREGRSIDFMENRIVKSYAPKIYHFVIDIKISP
ncbi:MAG: class I SAM-dependent methyltransferase family protein [Candidatus Hydrothermarchaeales archaeon]